MQLSKLLPGVTLAGLALGHPVVHSRRTVDHETSIQDESIQDKAGKVLTHPATWITGSILGLEWLRRKATNRPMAGSQQASTITSPAIESLEQVKGAANDLTPDQTVRQAAQDLTPNQPRVNPTTPKLPNPHPKWYQDLVAWLNLGDEGRDSLAGRKMLKDIPLDEEGEEERLRFCIANKIGYWRQEYGLQITDEKREDADHQCRWQVLSVRSHAYAVKGDYVERRVKKPSEGNTNPTVNQLQLSLKSLNPSVSKSMRMPDVGKVNWAAMASSTGTRISSVAAMKPKFVKVV